MKSITRPGGVWTVRGLSLDQPGEGHQDRVSGVLWALRARERTPEYLTGGVVWEKI